MNFDVITLFPEMVQSALSFGVIGKAFEKKIASLNLINPRDYTTDTHKTVDDRPFGGGDGMIMLFDPLDRAINSILESSKKRKIFLSPRGERLDDNKVDQLVGEDLILLCGRYGGVDQRILTHHSFEEVSVGDYVVSGGELPACSMIDAVMRKLPGVLGHESSAEKDSFAGNKGYEAPSFTRPFENTAGVVPEFLRSGNHKLIAQMRTAIGKALTILLNPDYSVKHNIYLMDKEIKAIKSLKEEELSLLGLSGQIQKLEKEVRS